ncbi:acylphosphatase [Kocuria sp. HSID16901]|uniref:acylphosphatase n=1 Tax=Kocuria sp. HSID16901 TaxID=2419505 RepID=UPI000A805471
MGWMDSLRGRSNDRDGGATGAMPEARLEVWVSGRVQGVGFRWWTRGVARKNALVGFAENLSDGRVWIVAEGARSGIDALWEALNSGDTAGEVSSIEREDPEPTGEFQQFGVK